MSGRDFNCWGNVVMWPIGATVAKNVELGSPERKEGPSHTRDCWATHGICTRCTQNKLMYGWNVALPIDIIAGPSSRAMEIPQCPVVYVEWLRTSLENSFRHARESLKRASSRQKKYYDQKAGESGFQVGDWWVYQGDSSQSGEVETLGDQSPDTDSENLDTVEFDDRQDPEVDPEDDSQAMESGEKEKLPYQRSRRHIRAPNRLNLKRG